MEKVDLKKLVTDLKALPALSSAPRAEWVTWCEDRGLGEIYGGSKFRALSFADAATNLYTLRAYLRGKIHRTTPPAPIRDFNRTMREQGRPARITWNRITASHSVAMKYAAFYVSKECTLENALAE